MTVLSAEEYRTTIGDFNLTDDASTLGHCVHQLVESAAGGHPDKTALVCGDRAVTYEELNSLADQLADILIEEGIGRGDVVGVGLSRSVHLVAALLAVMKTGAAYVPVDPTYPAERINYMLNDAAAKLAVVSTRTCAALDAWKGTCLNIDEITARMPSTPRSGSGSLGVDVQPEDLAYVLYTSGSTGRPKGVDMSHGAVCNMLLSLQQKPGCSEADRLLAVSTISFDMAVPELFLPLSCGATVVMAQEHHVRDAGALLQLMRRHGVTMMQGTPTIWQMLIDADWSGEPRLVKMLSAGEPLSRQLADDLLNCGDQMWNLYGPTEAAVHATAWNVVRGEEMIVGKPIANYRLYVLGEDLSPVPLGSPGEIYIGGPGLARGYRNKQELTKSQFISNPFHQGLMYRTGDLGCFMSPGKLRVLGRADDQVKIRGHRIEPGEVESVITDHDCVSRAVVISRHGRLVAYCVRMTADAPESRPEIALDRLLRPWVSARLPAYMVPAFFVELDAFPATLNRKIDRKALPDPVPASSVAAKGMVDSTPDADLENQIIAIWSGILGHDQISVHDNFFEIGGDSGRVIRVQTKLKQVLGRSVSPAKLFEHYTVRTLASYIGGGMQKEQNKGNLHQPGGQTNHHEARDEDIAVISMACRLPGGAITPEDFWTLLEKEVDAIIDVPEGRWDDDDAGQNGSYCRRGGFIPSIDMFDAPFFGISPREAASLDPTHALMLEMSWEVLERAGYTTERLRGSQTGVFVGVSSIAAYQHGYDCAGLEGYSITGTAGGTLSGRVSYVLGLEGPAMTIDTACSSSLVATHVACNALRQGECDMAVSGGVSLMLTPGLHAEFSRLGGMSADGSCRAFASDTQGTGWGEGAAAIVLKRLSDAQRDGDVIHAVLRGTAVNHGGRSSASLTTPSGPAQQRLIRTALAAARLQPGDIDYVEAHGTGTRLGDPIEAGALGEVFGEDRGIQEHGRSGTLWVGSAKSNIGHTQAAAGLVGMVKVMLAMRHNSLPPTLHVNGVPTREVDWEAVGMAPVQKQQPWPPNKSGRRRRAGVSAFGIGGTNAHAIIEEPPPPPPPPSLRGAQSAPLPRVLPLLLSGRSEAALRDQADKLRRHLMSSKGGDEDEHRALGNVAYSLATTRNHFKHRLVLRAKDKAELLCKLANASGGGIDYNNATSPSSLRSERKKPRVAMLFTGQGSQWAGMGKGLAGQYPVFRASLEAIADKFKTHLDAPLLQVMWADPSSEASELLERTEYAQPALFALEVALWRLWESWGVRPDIVLGHSVGELAAAHVAGIMGIDDACRLVAERGRLMQPLSGHSGGGGMVSLEANASEVTDAIATLGLHSKIDIASHNTPTQSVASGDVDALASLVAYFADKGRKSTKLGVSHAFHSHHMDSALDCLARAAATVRFQPAQTTIVSSVTGAVAHIGQLGEASYWAHQARAPVRFSDGIRTLVDQGVDVFLELGPRAVLCSMGAACVEDANVANSIAWLCSLAPKKEDAADFIQGSLAQLHVRHVPVDWPGYFRPFDCRRVELPTYSFQRSSYSNGTASIKRTASAPKKCSGSDVGDAGSPAIDGPQRFQFDINWHQIKTGDEIVSPLSGSWGLLCPNGEVAWAEEVSLALLSSPSSSASPTSSPSPSSLSPVLPRLVHISHLKDAQHLDGVICLWDSHTEHIQQDVRTLTELALAQLQDAARTAFAPPIVWITRQAVGTGVDDDGAVQGLAAAPLWGLMRTARSEHPNLRLRLIDLSERQANINGLASALALSDEPECALRKGGLVFVPRMERRAPSLSGVRRHHGPPTTTTGTRLPCREGAVLITGGTGGIGQRVARWLVGTHGIRDLVLVSRRGAAAPGATSLANDLARLGARVSLVAGDVADHDGVKAIMSHFNQSRPLRGVIHAAGALDDSVLAALTPQRCDATFAPKAFGALHLHRLTRGMDLDFFVLFSSVSGILGTAGQGNYAAANTFLDALAYSRRAQNLAATAIAWGLWDGDGMAARISPSSRVRFAQSGLDALSPEEGLELLGLAVSARESHALTVAAAFSVERLQAYYQDGAQESPSLLRSLIGSGRNGGDEDVKRAARRQGRGESRQCDGSATRTTLHEAATDEERAALMLAAVRSAVAKNLGFLSPEDVDMDLPLQQMGLDSLTAVLTRNELAALTGLALPANTTLGYQSVRALAELLLSLIPRGARASPTSSATETTGASTPPPTPAPTCSDNSQDVPSDSSPSTTAPNSRLLCPALGLVPPHSPPQLFASSWSYFETLAWCSRLLQESSPTTGLLPGHGQAIGFVLPGFNPSSPERDQFIGGTLSHRSENGKHGNNKACSSTMNKNTPPPLRHMLCLFRPSDAAHLADASRPIQRVVTLFALGDGTSGFPGMVHGGLIATLLDESLGAVNELNAALGKRQQGGGTSTNINVTASLSIEYLAPLTTMEEVVCVTAWLAGVRGQKTIVKAEVSDSRGGILAAAESTWATVAVPSATLA
ncbi:putative PKS/NRPS-like protein biosynthetic cluster [Purpureocillium takamizusanense]|uniref:PKS/NRPS-like protein biosynthetic cluster n=1 Tax=Purpureocillium takamizusanense TaxID=2060973 RepID=A0A9Q8V8Z6_9HYPO|nr:putative PKS/NRPS-like protein biosynthetic cluster [Purpureocillium takamizusanense]UNI16131.1 putative PKS/NRPS-like protein biosynthetic cluster [Purpureocillium takamizusanense]